MSELPVGTGLVHARSPVAGEPRRDAGWISVRGLTRRYGQHVGLHPLELDVEPGMVTGLLGPNGSGKSTLLRMLLGLVRPTSGAAAIDGIVLRGDGTAVRRRATYMPGEIAVYGEMSGLEHMRWLLRGRDRSALGRAREVADGLGLDLRRKVRTFSHGMKRQLFFSAALGPDVRVRVLDEPTDGLDPSTRRRVLEVLRQDSANGVTILLSSHHLAEVEDVCARLVFLNRGQLLSDERTSVLRDRARSIVHLAWGPDVDVSALAGPLRLGLDAEVVLREQTATVHLAAGDPLEYVAALRAATEVPTPAAVEFGKPSLADLYRDLYGVEGL